MTAQACAGKALAAGHRGPWCGGRWCEDGTGGGSGEMEARRGDLITGSGDEGPASLP